MKLISILTPFFNSKQWILESFTHLNNQSYTKWEWILVNDGSTDKPEKYLQEIKNEKIKIITLPKNYGRGYARRTALNYAKGDLTAVWDIDDIYFPDRLEKAARFLDGSKTFFCNPTVLIHGKTITGQRGFFKPFFCRKNMFVHHTLVADTNIFKKIGYQPKYRCGEDFKIVYELCHWFTGEYYPDALSAYREDLNISAKKSFEINSAQLDQFLSCKTTTRKIKVVVYWYLKLRILQIAGYLNVPFYETLRFRPQESYAKISELNRMYLKKFL